MTVQAFILLYNDTFKYLREHFGEDAVRQLWGDISDKWCKHLEALTAEQGLAGMNAYWGGNGGTLSREKAAYSTELTDDSFSIVMHECPSVGELIQHGQEPMHGALTYCDHCPALYAPVVARHGFTMDYHIEHLPNGGCSGRCHFRVTPTP